MIQVDPRKNTSPLASSRRAGPDSPPAPQGGGAKAQHRAAGAPDLVETLLRFESAHKRRDLDEMRACFHDEARIESVASGGHPLGPDETVEAIRAAFEDGVYAIGDWRYEEVRPEALLSWTGARRRLGESGMRDEVVYRIITGRDGLMWRARLYPTRDEAVACLELHGDDLGI